MMIICRIYIIYNTVLISDHLGDYVLTNIFIFVIYRLGHFFIYINFNLYYILY